MVDRQKKTGLVVFQTIFRTGKREREKRKIQRTEGIHGFFLIMIAIYMLWWIWERRLGFWPLYGCLEAFSEWMVRLLYCHSEWALTCLFRLEAWFDGQRLSLGPPGTLTINNPCSGIKQFTQFSALMILYPGPWLKKLWFVPAGLIVVHLANMVRIVGLSLVIVLWPDTWHFFHDIVAKGLFYLVFFLLWVAWEEWVRKTRRLPVAHDGKTV